MAEPDPSQPPPVRHALSARRLDGPDMETIEVHPALAKAGWTPPGARLVRAAGAIEAPPPQPEGARSRLYDRAIEAAGAVRAAFGEVRARVAVILGSGLGAFAERLDGVQFLGYDAIPGFPPRTGVKGHKGRLASGLAGGAPCLVMQGRFHAYEGYDLDQVAFPVRVLAVLGVRRLVVTNAAGGIADDLAAGDLMLIEDHLNLLGQSPLRGPNDDRLGPRFPDMTECYPARLRALAAHLAPPEHPLKEGIYAALPGPQYETPAEIRMLKALGADAVGMSTVPEVIAARHMGLECIGISGIANKAAGLTPGHRLGHEEVVGTMDRIAERFVALLAALVPALAAEAADAA